MIKEAIKKLNAKLECSICLETFKQPKLLPCYHMFCKSLCLEKLVTKDGRSSLTCPTCQHIVPLSERGVAGLQLDFHIDNLFEIRDAFDKAAESSKTQCGNCKERKATGYCRYCEDFMCNNCQAAHQALKLTKRDQVEMSKASIVSCLENTSSVLKTGPEGEVLTKKNALLQRIEEAVTNYLPEVISETRADIELVTDGKKECQKNYKDFLEIRKGGPVSLKNSCISGGVESPISMYVVAGEQRTIVFQAKNEQNEIFEGKLKMGVNVIHSDTRNEPINRYEIIKQKNGQYRIIYQPMKRGKHMLHLTVNGHLFQDKPFPIVVLPSSKQVQIVKELDGVRGVAINSTGEMVVVNKNGTQISMLKPTGEKIRSFGTQGTENGQLSDAYGVTVDKHDNIYVSDYGNSRIQKFKRGGQFMKAIGNEGHHALEFFNWLLTYAITT